MADSNIRNRGSKPNGTTRSSTKSNAHPRADGPSSRISLLDIFRILTTVIVSSLALSYYLTSGESVLWGYRPWFTEPALVARYIRGPVALTASELSLYNGTDPDLPIYIAINNTVYDVSAGTHIYGPGGSYHIFAGQHATRAFTTGCFAEDLTNDLRGAEMMHIAVEDDEYEVISSGARKTRAEKERREARKKVKMEVEKWTAFYRDSKKYFTAGRVIGDEPDSFTGEVRKLCDQAEKGRPKRSKLNGKVNEKVDSPGKPVH